MDALFSDDRLSTLHRVARRLVTLQAAWMATCSSRPPQRARLQEVKACTAQLSLLGLVAEPMLKRHLELVERHVLEGERHIARQREIVARLEHGLRESTTLRIARELLLEMERAQSLHVADRDRLREQLGP